MAAKVIVTYHGSLTNDSVAEKKKSVADQLGVCPEDIILLPGLSLSVVDLPDEMTKARAKADKQADAEREKAEKEQQAAEVEAAKPKADEPKAEEPKAAHGHHAKK